MREQDWNRAMDKAETWSEWLLMQVIGWPKPWTAIATGAVLFLAGIGAVTIWKVL